MKTIKIKGTTNEKYIFESDAKWLQFRKEHIGASDAPIIMGVAKWKTNDGRIKTPKLLWEEKLGLDSMLTDNNATRYGKKMEEPARKAYEKMINDLVQPVVIKDTKMPYLMASLDGLNIIGDRAVEIKNANQEDHELAKKGQVPEKYYPQVQMQYLVTGVDKIDYFSFHKEEGIIVEVKRDDEYISEMKSKLDEFWKCVTSLKTPPLTEDDFIPRDKEWEAKAAALFKVQEDKKRIAKEEEKLKKELKSLSMGENSFFGDYRYGYAIQRGLVDYSAVPELSEVNLDLYRKDPVARWTLKHI